MQPRLTTALSLVLLCAIGCRIGSTRNSPAGDSEGLGGSVVGGQQPIVHALIQLYAVGTKGDGSSARPLLSKTVVTDQNGHFDISGLYDCSGVSDVYVTATGGQPSPNLPNPQIALMTALGSCSSLNAFTNIEINELTTVAATNALAPYMESELLLGSGAGDAASLSASFEVAGQFVNTTTGIAPGSNVPSGYAVPLEQINTLGDVVAGCINSGGGVAGDGSSCGSLFLLTTPPDGAPPANTIDALHNLALYPGLNSTSLFRLLSATPVFQPDLMQAPANFTITLLPIAVNGPLVLSPSVISFLATPIGSTSQGPPTTLLNNGASPVAISSVGLIGVDAGDFSESNDCPSVLSPGASCDIQTTFCPWDTAQRTATLQINSTALSATLSGKSSLPTWEQTLYAAQPTLYLSFNEVNGPFQDHAGAAAFSTVGSIIPGQAGFDNTWKENKSAAFTDGSYLIASDFSTGDLEWNKPFSILVHIDNLQYPSDGTAYFLSKGDVGGGYSKSWYELITRVNQGIPQLCFVVSGAGGIVAPYNVRQSVCTRVGTTAIPTGYNYDIVASNDGTGSPSALQLFLNGTNEGAIESSIGYHFGSVVATIYGIGVGYGNSTSFNADGGGAGCVVAGSMAAANGVPTGITYTQNWGCTSVPVLQLIAPTGTGATLGVALFGATMSTQTTSPLIIGGAQLDGSIQGMYGSNGSTASQTVDEFAVFPTVLSARTIGALYWETKFYQRLLDEAPATPKKVIFDNDGCADTDNLYALALVIAAQRLGYVNLEGVVDTDGNGLSAAMNRQMLDQAGLTQVPVSVSSRFGVTSSGICLATNINAYDEATATITPQATTDYEAAAVMYRKILAANQETPVSIILGGSFRGVADLMQSPADAISAMTGAQLVARDAANGGGIFAQGLGADISFSSDNSLEDWVAGKYVVENNGSLPIFWYGGSPQSSGPGILATRSNMDPLFLLASSRGTDARTAWDSLPAAAFLSSEFARGINVEIEGSGTGYADSTSITSIGGGDACSVSGEMNSLGGVPATIQAGVNYAHSSYTGLGAGCSTVPNVLLASPTGNGVVLKASSTVSCGTVTITSKNSGITSTATCSNHYFLPYSSLADPSNPQILQWFLTAVIDPPPDSP